MLLQMSLNYYKIVNYGFINDNCRVLNLRFTPFHKGIQPSGNSDITSMPHAISFSLHFVVSSSFLRGRNSQMRM